jgi:hypothetical protein
VMGTREARQACDHRFVDPQPVCMSAPACKHCHTCIDCAVNLYVCKTTTGTRAAQDGGCHCGDTRPLQLELTDNCRSAASGMAEHVVMPCMRGSFLFQI